MLFVLTIQQRHHEDPDEYNVVGVYDTLEKAKSIFNVVNEWIEEDGSYYGQDAYHDHYEITPVDGINKTVEGWE